MEKNQKIITAIILIALALFFLPKLDLFSILGANQYNANSGKTFLTNVNFDSNEQISQYTADSAWVSVDWNNDGQLEGYGRYVIIDSTNDVCLDKAIISYSPKGFRAVKYIENEQQKGVGVCSVDGKYVVVFSDLDSKGAIINISQGTCMNCGPQNQTNNTNQTNPPLPACVYNYSNWTACSNNTQTRTVLNNPTSCTGQPVVEQTCEMKQNFFMQEAFKIGDTSIKWWMVILVIAIFIILFISMK